MGRGAGGPQTASETSPLIDGSDHGDLVARNSAMVGGQEKSRALTISHAAVPYIPREQLKV